MGYTSTWFIACLVSYLFNIRTLPAICYNYGCVACVCMYGLVNLILLCYQFLVTVPGIPRNVTAELVDASSLKVTWALPTELNGVLETCQIVHYMDDLVSTTGTII